MRVKICGVTNVSDALFIEEAGADAIGVVISADSRRNVSIDKAKEIFNALGPFICRVVVTHTRSYEELSEILSLKPDILCIQETKAHEDQLTSAIRHPKGYYSYFSSAEKKGYSGVAVYSKTEPLSVIRGFKRTEFNTEGRILILEYPKFILFNIYFPNGKASKERLDFKLRFYDECLLEVERIHNEGRNVIICGDVNTAHTETDLSRPAENSKVSGFLPKEREWIDRVLDAGFLDTFRIFTKEPGYYSWWDLKSNARDRNVGWRIDYFFANEEIKENIKNASIMSHIYGSDHCPVSLDVEF